MIPITYSAFPYIDTIPNFSSATYSPNDAQSYCSYHYFQKKSVWYNLKPYATGSYEFSTLGGIVTDAVGKYEMQTYITLFEGLDCSALQHVKCGYSYLGAVKLFAEKEYKILLEDDLPVGILPKVAFTINESPSQPPNDECVNAVIIPSMVSFPYFTDPVYLSQATVNPNDPRLSCKYRAFSRSETVWYTWSPSISDYYDFTTEQSTNVLSKDVFGGRMLAVIGILEGATCDLLEEIECNLANAREIEHPCDIYLYPLRPVLLEAGVTYYIMVETEANAIGGNLTLSVKPSIIPPPPVPPPNNECMNATIVDLFESGLLVGNISGASFDFERDVFCGVPITTPGVWYKFTNTFQNSIPVTAEYIEANFYTRISVFKGGSCTNLECVGGSQSLGTVYFKFLASAQTTYYILAHSMQGDCGYGKYTFKIEGSKNYFALIDSKTDRAIEALDAYVDYGTIASTSSSLNIEAVFAGQSLIRSARLTFDDPPVSYCENKAPYSVFRDKNGDFHDAIIPVGAHEVTATAYTRQGCKGRPVTSISKMFDVIKCYCAIHYVYVQEFLDHEVLYDGAVLQSGCNTTIQAFVGCGFEIDSVTFILSNSTATILTREEKVDPYYLFGNLGLGNVNKGFIAPGEYNLEIIIDGINTFRIDKFTVLDSGGCK